MEPKYWLILCLLIFILGSLYKYSSSNQHIYVLKTTTTIEYNATTTTTSALKDHTTTQKENSTMTMMMDETLRQDDCVIPPKVLHHRRQPEFFIIGCQKCGTSTLHANLKRLDPIYMPKLETHFFDNRFSRGIEYFSEKFLFKVPTKVVAGAKNPSLMFDPRFIKRVHTAFPKVRIIVILRNPSDRVFSAWKMYERIKKKAAKILSWSFKI